MHDGVKIELYEERLHWGPLRGDVQLHDNVELSRPNHHRPCGRTSTAVCVSPQ